MLALLTGIFGDIEVMMRDFFKKYGVYIFFAVCFIICFLRALKGFCWTDESFYYSTADRFYRGDALIKEEWYRTQISSVFCLPFYALYVLLFGSNAGVILYFRILYLLLSFTVSVAAFRIFKKEYPVSVSLCISTLIIFYAHLNITTFSYYMLSMDFLLLSMLLIYDYKNTKSKPRLVLAGSIFALSVMAMPALVVGFFAVFAVIVICLLIRRFAPLTDKAKKSFDSIELFTICLYTIIGIIIPAVIFAIYMFSKVSLGEIIKALPGIMVDNEHDFTFGFLVRKYFRSIKEIYGKWTYLGYFFVGVTFVFQKFLKKKPVSDFIVLADFILFIILAVKSYGHTSYIQAALVIFAIPIFFLSNKKNIRLFLLLGGWGIILSVTYCFTSSDFLYVMSIGFFIVAVACIAFMYDYVKSSVEDKEKFGFITRMVAVILPLCAVYCCCVTVGLRLTNVYRDAPISQLTCKITKGPGRGLFTTKEHLEYYEDVCEVIDQYASGDGRVMFSKILPWGYLYSNMKCGYPTTWRATAYNADQLEEFYKLNPDNYPDVIFVLDEQYGSYDGAGDVEDDHNPNLDEMNDYWKEYIKENNMSVVKTKCGLVYIK